MKRHTVVTVFEKPTQTTPDVRVYKNDDEALQGLQVSTLTAREARTLAVHGEVETAKGGFVGLTWCECTDVVKTHFGE